MNRLSDWVQGKNWWADIQAGSVLPIESLFTVNEIQPPLWPTEDDERNVSQKRTNYVLLSL